MLVRLLLDERREVESRSGWSRDRRLRHGGVDDSTDGDVAAVESGVLFPQVQIREVRVGEVVVVVFADDVGSV